MSDLKLVAPDQPTPLERQLLNAAAHESPSAEQRMRVRQALGLPAVAVLPLAPASNTARRAVMMKAAAGGLIVISAAALLVYAGFGRTPQVSAVAMAAPVALPSTPVQAAPAQAPEPVAAPLPPIEPLPSNVPDVKLAPKSARATNAAASSSATDPGGDLTEQLRLIDTARSAVAAGDAKSASAAITLYQTHFPRGAFGQEAAVLRIETVDLQGNHGQAAALAKSFLAKHPNSPHVSVVQRIAGRAQ